VAGDLLLDDAGTGCGQGERIAGRFQQPGGGVPGVQVVLEGAPGGGPALIVGVGAVDEVGGVGAQQVMEGVPVGRMLVDDVGAGELVQQRSSPVDR
jgi:hypothetical protein